MGLSIIPKLRINLFMVGERSMLGEALAKAGVDGIEVRMSA